MDMQSCPAFGKYCSTCGLKNHLSSICLTKRKAQNIKAIDKLATDESSDSGETLFTVSLSPQSSNQWEIHAVQASQKIKTQNVAMMHIKGGKEVELQVDTGATYNQIKLCDLQDTKYAKQIEPTGQVLKM